MATLDERVLCFVSDERGVPLAQLALTTTLFGDLRVDGDDAEDLLLAFKDHFEIDMEGCQMDQHFGPEGMQGWGPLYWLCLAWRGIAEKGSTPESRARLKPITIQDLVDSARLQKWSIGY